MNAALQLTASEIAALTNLFKQDVAEGKNFGRSYTFVQQRIIDRQSRGQFDFDDKSIYWYMHAPAVNVDDTTDSTDIFIRSALFLALRYEQHSQTDIQSISNKIASDVLSRIIRDGAIPTVDTILPTDISSALAVTGGHVGDWGGSFYYWNTPYQGSTVGQIILSDPAEYERFVTTAGYALFETAGQYPAHTTANMFVTGFNSFLGSVLPPSVAWDVAGRALSLALGGNAAGNPDHIDSYWYESRNNTWLNIDSPTSDPFSFTLDPTVDAATTARLNAVRQLRLQHQDMFGGSASTHGAADVGPAGCYSLASADGATFDLASYRADGTRILTASAAADGSLSISAATGDILTFGAGASASISGGGFTANLAAGDAIGLAGGSGITVTGGNSRIAATANTRFSLSGSNDLVTLAAADVITLSGIGDALTAASCTIVASPGTVLNVAGGGDVITLRGAGATLGLLGLGYNVSATGSTVSGGAGTSFTLFGGNDVVNASRAGDYIGLNGTGYAVQASGCTVAGGNATSFSLFGARDVVNLYGAGDYAALNGTDCSVSATGCTVAGGSATSFGLFGGRDVVNLYGAGDYAALNGADYSVGATGCTIGGGNATSLTLFGGRDVVNLYGVGDTAGLNGTDYSVGATGCTIAGGNATSFTLFGARDVVNLYGAGDSVSLNGLDESVTATGCTIVAGEATSFTLSGARDALQLNAAGTDVWLSAADCTVTAAHSVIAIASGGSATFSGDGDTIALVGNGAVASYSHDPNDAVRITPGMVVSQDVWFADGHWEDTAYNPSPSVSRMVVTTDRSHQPDREEITWNAGNPDARTVYLYDRSNQKLGGQYDTKADGSYVYTEYNTGHPGQDWSKFVVNVDANGHVLMNVPTIYNAAGLMYGGRSNMVSHPLASEVIGRYSELNTPASFAAPDLVGSLHSIEGDAIWLDHHLAPSRLAAASSALASATHAALHLQPALLHDSIITVEILGFGT